MSLFSFLRRTSPIPFPKASAKGLFSNLNFGAAAGGNPMGLFGNPNAQQATKLGQDRTGLFQTLFPNSKMGPPAPQNPAMLAAGIVNRPTSQLNESAPFVGPVRPPPPDTSLTPRPAGYTRPTMPALSAKDQKLADKRLATADKPPVQNVLQTRANSPPKMNMLEQLKGWEADLRAASPEKTSIPLTRSAAMANLFSAPDKQTLPTPKTREQLVRENPTSQLGMAYTSIGKPPLAPKSPYDYLNKKGAK